MNQKSGVTRRSFIQTVGISAAGSSIAGASTTEHGQPDHTRGPDDTTVELRVNGTPVRATIEPGDTLLETLRRHLGQTGTKEVCDRGACGACSVQVDGKLVCSCMMLALDAEGRDIQTVEGLAGDDETLHDLQIAFIRHDALQCAFCTPGLLMASRTLLDHNPKPTLEEIKKELSGNLCRCGTYTNVFNAVLDASGQSPIIDGGDA